LDRPKTLGWGNRKTGFHHGGHGEHGEKTKIEKYIMDDRGKQKDDVFFLPQPL
jgi:hypothetical protein